MMERDRKRAGTCNFMMARKNFSFTHMYLLVPKKSPYKDFISQGYLLGSSFFQFLFDNRNQPWYSFILSRIEKARESGILYLWRDWYIPATKQCQKSFYEIPKNQRLTLKNLSGAFVILIVGYTLATITFVIEIFIFHRCNKTRRIYVKSSSAA